MREQPWLFDLVPFETMIGRRVLEIGCGAGFDALVFGRVKADYVGVDITPENVVRARAHLALYGMDLDVQEADAELLPFESQSFDIVYSNGVLHHTPDMGRALREARRVLRPGGEFWLIVYNRDSIFYWLTLGLFGHILSGGFLKRSFQERLAMIEYTTSNQLPIVNVYSRSELRRLLRSAGFDVRSVRIRKLLPEDLPGIPILSRLWTRIPQAGLDRIGKRFGWYLIAHGLAREDAP